MSDKFFFKGRQDARQHHTDLGFETRPNQKIGTKKFPMTLTVTSEERRKTIAAQLTDAHLFANITLDTSDAAIENITELTAILNKGGTVTTEKTPARNEPCHCGSGKKYKKCCQ